MGPITNQTESKWLRQIESAKLLQIGATNQMNREDTGVVQKQVRSVGVIASIYALKASESKVISAEFIVDFVCSAVFAYPVDPRAT